MIVVAAQVAFLVGPKFFSFMLKMRLGVDSEREVRNYHRDHSLEKHAKADVKSLRSFRAHRLLVSAEDRFPNTLRINGVRPIPR